MPKLTKVGTAIHGSVTRLSATRISQGSGSAGPSQLAVTAARNGKGNLEVVAWSVANSGAPSAVSSRTEGVASEVGVVSVGNLRFVVAVRDGCGELRLILYRLSANGTTLSRLSTRTGSKVIDFALTSTRDGEVTVASRLLDRRVEVSTWGISDADTIGNPILLVIGSGTSTALAIDGSLGELCLGNRLDTATLRLRAFKGPDTLGGDGTGGKVRSLSLVSAGLGGPYYIGTISEENVAVRTGPGGLSGRLILDAGLLEVTRWEYENLSLDSPLVQVASGALDGMAGIAWELGLLKIGPSSVFLSAARGADTYETLLEKNRGKPKMRVIAWETKGGKIERIAQGNAMGQHSQIALAELRNPNVNTTRSGRVMAAARDGNGKLKVAIWDLTE